MRCVRGLSLTLLILAPVAGRSSDFTDDALQTLLRQGGTGVIYAASEHMPLSIRGLKDIEAAVRALKLDLQVVIDPDSDFDHITREAAAAGIDASHCGRLASRELMRRNLTIHYPSILIYRRGAIVGQLLPGYLSTADYEKYIQQVLAIQ